MGQAAAPAAPAVPSAGPIVAVGPAAVVGPTDGYLWPIVIGALVLGGVALLISASKK
jgi:hypothetical protein